MTFLINDICLLLSFRKKHAKHDILTCLISHASSCLNTPLPPTPHLPPSASARTDDDDDDRSGFGDGAGDWDAYRAMAKSKSAGNGGSGIGGNDDDSGTAVTRVNQSAFKNPSRMYIPKVIIHFSATYIHTYIQ
jgi:hypothetical protein